MDNVLISVSPQRIQITQPTNKCNKKRTLPYSSLLDYSTYPTLPEIEKKHQGMLPGMADLTPPAPFPLPLLISEVHKLIHSGWRSTQIKLAFEAAQNLRIFRWWYHQNFNTNNTDRKIPLVALVTNMRYDKGLAAKKEEEGFPHIAKLKSKVVQKIKCHTKFKSTLNPFCKLTEYIIAWEYWSRENLKVSWGWYSPTFPISQSADRH